MDLFPKDIWRSKIRDTWSFYCMQCKAPRIVPGRPNPATFRNISLVALTSATFTLVAFPLFGFKGLVSFVLFWMVFETFNRMKFRGYVACPRCGFDPFLYLTNVKRARQEIEGYWRQKFEEKGVPFPKKNPVNSAKGVKPADESPASLES